MDTRLLQRQCGPPGSPSLPRKPVVLLLQLGALTSCLRKRVPTPTARGCETPNVKDMGIRGLYYPNSPVGRTGRLFILDVSAKVRRSLQLFF